MKRLAAILFAGGTLWLFLAAGAVFADNGPHLQRGGGLTADTCASCHRAHTAGNPMLTTAAQPAICYQCHGLAAAGSSTGVQGGRGDTATEALRGGGVEFALLDSATPTRYSFGPGNGLVPTLGTAAATTSHHAVDFSDEVIWGNGAISGPTLGNPGTATELRCGSCHNPHGNRTYRILRPNPVDSGASGTAQVYVLDVTDWQPPANTSLSGTQIPTVGAGGTGTYAYTTTNYWRPQDPNWKGADFVLQGDTPHATTPNAIVLGQDSKDFLAVTTQWCTTCHDRYMAGAGAYEESSGDAIFTYRHPVWGAPTDPTHGDVSGSAPACLQCHVSHGTNAAMGTASAAVTLPGSNVVPTEKSRLLRVDSRGVCQLCHFR